ncbi:class I mannose-6-phosphate isomerase [[Clostridium] symbiosum]|uniref:type I phosphomannose isomerase catalytic subunit n=1 Tax=Clostridium symbiosum TaxID=1512 RepID=UPI00210A5C8C|nr:type I phosphomannose isomerase catalytic subunit [[Clostridium] symbiosum]MCQ4834102.1 class I mannose-6-phosphate isomerase [[Clostridium] symbiosum]
MTSISMNFRNKPFLLKPVGKDYLWGGERLKYEYGKEVDMAPLAETWECSTHPDGLSMAASGAFSGRTLKEILEIHPEYIGTHPTGNGGLPILMKFIDAKKDLSVQVHPGDEYAGKYENGQSGKTEMWYVADARKDTRLVYGFYHDISREELEESLVNGTVERYLQKVTIHKDDVFFIEAGTVHAIGAGALIVEVQESSNLTYRMYDYNRLDKNGKPRELHIKKALDVADRRGSAQPRQPLRILKYRKGAASEILCRCRYFQVERHLLNTETARKLLGFRTLSNSFQVFVCLDGCGVLYMEDGDMLNFFKGDTVFVPAQSMRLKFHGKAQLLSVTC